MTDDPMIPASAVRALSDLKQAAQNAVDFLGACEWNDRTSENDASDIAQRLQDALLASASVATPASPWRPINTVDMGVTFPPSRALIWHPSWRRPKAAVVNCGEWIAEGKIVQPTHWMPLPDPPQEPQP